jgi:hypothetical protein
MTPKQQQILQQFFEAMGAWNEATGGGDQQQFAEDDEASLLFGYNPYRDAHGRFAPGPHAARPGEGEGGGHAGGEGAGGKGHAKAGGGKGAGKAKNAGGGGHVGGGKAGKVAGQGHVAKVSKAKAEKVAKAQHEEAVKEHRTVEEMHAAAVAKREGGSGRVPRTEAERNLTQARSEQRRAERELTAAQHNETVTSKHVAETSLAIHQAQQTAREELNQHAVERMLQSSPRTAQRHATVKAEAQRLRAIADAQSKAWEAHYAQHGEDPGEHATNELIRAEQAASNAEHYQRQIEERATKSVTVEQMNAHPAVVAANAAHEHAVEAAHAATQRRVQAESAIDPWRVAEARAAVNRERGGSGYVIRDDGGKGQEHLQALFGRKLSHEEIGGLVGALPGDHIQLTGATRYDGSHSVEIMLHGAGFDTRRGPNAEGNGAYWASRELTRDGEGHLVMHNHGNTQNEPGQGRAAGAGALEVGGGPHRDERRRI